MGKSVGVYEAKNSFTAILKDVGEGEVFHITKHGKPVAMIVPYSEGDPELQSVISELKSLAKRVALGNDVDIKNIINEGRR